MTRCATNKADENSLPDQSLRPVRRSNISRARDGSDPNASIDEKMHRQKASGFTELSSKFLSSNSYDGSLPVGLSRRLADQSNPVGSKNPPCPAQSSRYPLSRFPVLAEPKDNTLAGHHRLPRPAFGCAFLRLPPPRQRETLKTATPEVAT